jgi:Zn-dependent protease with chaperone function
MLLIIFVLAFLSEPVANAYSRHLEHQADQYGLEVVHGLFPNSGEVAAQSFQKLGEEWLEYPYVSKLAVIWEWNHPTISERIHFALTYDPWDKGHQPEFVGGNTNH